MSTLHVTYYYLFIEYTATESVRFTVHWQDLRTTDNRPVFVYAAPSCKTHQTQPLLWCVYITALYLMQLIYQCTGTVLLTRSIGDL